MTLPGLFVVGTDTGVGKTHVASALARSWSRAGHRVGVLKPVASGGKAHREAGSSRTTPNELIEAVGGDSPHERGFFSIVFEEAARPARGPRPQASGKPLDEWSKSVECRSEESLSWWEGRAEVRVVEGVGGLLCPLAEGATVADLAIFLDYPILIVAHRGLGTLNHTLLTVEAARSRGLRVAGRCPEQGEADRRPDRRGVRMPRS